MCVSVYVVNMGSSIKFSNNFYIGILFSKDIGILSVKIAVE